MEREETEQELIDKQPELKSGDMAKMLGIAESTVRKYASALEKAGYRSEHLCVATSFRGCFFVE